MVGEDEIDVARFFGIYIMAKLKLLRLHDKTKPLIKLARVQSSDSGMTWIMTFIDEVHRFMQTVIVPKFAPAEAVEHMYEELYVRWNEQIKESEWKVGMVDFR